MPPAYSPQSASAPKGLIYITNASLKGIVLLPAKQLRFITKTHIINYLAAPTDIYWYRIDYNVQTGYIPPIYVWKAKRDTSITLNPLYANYPTVGGSGIFYPYEKEWRYMHGCNSRKNIYLSPYCSSVEIYYNGTIAYIDSLNAIRE